MKFGDAERRVGEVLQPKDKIIFDGVNYEIILAGKPTCSRGEPKTDIYVLAENSSSKSKEEFKISFKKDNADFLENKTSAERAEQLFGKDWKNIVIKTTEKLRNNFLDRNLIFKEKNGRTQKGSITLGWKFELVNKLSGDLCCEMALTYKQVLDVYSGVTLAENKKDSTVNGKVIKNSGVASHMLVGALKRTDDNAQTVFDRLVKVEDFCKNEKVYAVFKAHNYRTFSSKDDGNRPLAVYIEWSVNNGKLCAYMGWQKPLETKGAEIRAMLLESLNRLGAHHTDDLMNKIDSRVKVYPSS